MEPILAAGLDAEVREFLRGNLEVADQYLSDAPDAPPMPGILGLLGHHPRLAAHWLALSGGLIDDPVLPPRDRELLVLRVSWRTQCHYEWAQHVRIATMAGVDDAEIAAVAAPSVEYSWSDRDRDLLAAADQMIELHHVDDATWARLEQYFDKRELLELLFVIGSYVCLALVLNSVRLQPDPKADFVSPELPGLEAR